MVNTKIGWLSCQHNLDKSFRRQRKRTAHKLGNPRLLRVSFHTLRHWKATIEYARTKDTLYVKQLLGPLKLENHRKIHAASTATSRRKIHMQSAKTVKEAKERVEAGFEYVTDLDEANCLERENSHS